MRPTWLEIDLGALGRNYRRLARRAAGARVIAVVKANAYGHGAAAVARALLGCGAERLAVATSGEGAGLRRAGIDAPVLLLGSLHPDDAEDAARWGLTPTLVTLEAARAYAAATRCTRPTRPRSSPAWEPSSTSCGRGLRCTGCRRTCGRRRGSSPSSPGRRGPPR